MSEKNKDQNTVKKYYQEQLSELSDEEAIKLIRENNQSFENQVDIFGLSSGPDLDLWHITALRIMDKDPFLGKAMLAGLFFGRGGYIDEESWHFKNEEKIPEFDRDQAISDLYDSELTYPETSELNSFYVFYRIIQFGNPKGHYWQDALERGLDLSMSLALSERQEHAALLLGYIAFYAPEDSELQKKALEGVEQIFQQDKDVFFETEFCTFCYPTRENFRQKAFDANPDSKLHELAFQSFCKKMKNYIKTDFDFRMSCLVKAIKSGSEALREEAANLYIEAFPTFAVGNTKSAYEGLLQIASTAVYECPRKYDSLDAGPPNYKTQVACAVLEKTLNELAYVDQGLAQKVFDSYERNPGAFAFGPPDAPKALEKRLKYFRDRHFDIIKKKEVYDLLKRGIDIRATIKRKD